MHTHADSGFVAGCGCTWQTTGAFWGSLGWHRAILTTYTSAGLPRNTGPWFVAVSGNNKWGFPVFVAHQLWLAQSGELLPCFVVGVWLVLGAWCPQGMVGYRNNASVTVNNREHHEGQTARGGPQTPLRIAHWVICGLLGPTRLLASLLPTVKQATAC